jgi:hypothetical protein
MDRRRAGQRPDLGTGRGHPRTLSPPLDQAFLIGTVALGAVVVGGLLRFAQRRT